jgi:hypothetical protein
MLISGVRGKVNTGSARANSTSVGAVPAGLHAQALEEPRLACQMAQQGKEQQAAGADHRQALPEVVMVIVTQLVGQHGLHFGGGQLVEQGVEEDDALGGAKAGEVGIAMGRALRAVHHEQARQAEAAAGHQAFDAALRGPSSRGLNLLNRGAMKVG